MGFGYFAVSTIGFAIILLCIALGIEKIKTSIEGNPRMADITEEVTKLFELLIKDTQRLWRWLMSR